MRTSRDGYVHELDALRCFAMSAVIMLHVGLLPFGWMGVWLFFVISGFAITRSLAADGQDVRAGRRISAFYVKRTLRIMPVYLFYLGLLSVYAAVAGYGFFWRALPYLLTLTYNMAIAAGSPVAGAPGAIQLWSISGEEQFYLLFPFLFILRSRRAFIATMAACLVLCPAARLAVSLLASGHASDAAARAVFFLTPLHSDAFAAGSLIALATRGRRVSEREGRIALAVGGAALAAYVLGYVAAQALHAGKLGSPALHDVVSGRLSGGGREVVAYTAIWLASAGLVVAAVAQVRWVAAICRPRAFRAVGRVSYGGYVYHGLILDLLTRLLPGWIVGTLPQKLFFLAVLYGSTLLAAFASHRWIERPFLRLKPGPRRPAPVAALA